MAVRLFFIFFVSYSLFAQSPSTIVGVGLQPPQPVSVAPGQLTTLFVLGLQDREAVAAALPLPSVLAGISVKLEWTTPDRTGWFPFPPLPLLGVHRLCRTPDVDPYACTLCRRAKGLDACVQTCQASLCDLAAITVQFPFNLYACSNSPVDPCFGRSAVRMRVTIVEDGVAGASFDAQPAMPNVHVVNSCDTVSRLFSTDLGTACVPLVRHADGSLVSPSNPAKANEVVSLYAVGLGIEKGESDILVGFDNWPMGRPVTPPDPLSPTTFHALYAGPAPGFVGLYQVNVRLPDTSTIPHAAASNCTALIGNYRMTLLVRSPLVSSSPPYPFGDNTIASATFCIESMAPGSGVWPGAQ